ncbi:hypothetical protein Y1Q_0002929 [Alligator mississippiensis]|uniref:Uncharacterized protein n=1 Tax=Alligator mississippiensis TaxID=8496 RepID=A0A151MCS7_ALLMI|nr:hypothetical protein Y1Q_0002929 [Alligator mississippiensis]
MMAVLCRYRLLFGMSLEHSGCFRQPIRVLQAGCDVLGHRQGVVGLKQHIYGEILTETVEIKYKSSFFLSFFYHSLFVAPANENLNSLALQVPKLVLSFDAGHSCLHLGLQECTSLDT